MTLGKEKMEQIRYFTEFKIVKDSITQINPEFSLCTVLVAYHGDNRNRSSISKKTFEECLWTIYGIPIVGEWVRMEEDQNKETWGSHGGRLIWDENGIKYEQTTKPFGFVTEEAYKNAAWIEILEKDGHTKHEYLKLEKCILWNSRYEECDSILEENFGQSMEISVVDGHYRDDSYFEISKFIFSALCILGTVEPCFESAMIGRQYELNQFKLEFQLMMEQYKRLNADGATTESAFIHNEGEPTVDDGHKFNEKEDVKLGKKILFSEVCGKIKEVMAGNTFRHRTGKQYDKYIVLSVSEADKTFTVVDREADYAAYSIPYIATQTDEGLVVNIDYDKKVDLTIAAVEKTNSENSFQVKSEVEMFSNDLSEYDVSNYKNGRITELEEQLEEIKVHYEKVINRTKELEKHLNAFETEKKQYMAQKHKEIIDTIIASAMEEMGKYSELMEYRVNVNYSKTTEQVEKDIKEIRYNFMLKKQPGSKRAFSGIEAEVADNTSQGGNTIAERYGADVAKYFK